MCAMFVCDVCVRLLTHSCVIVKEERKSEVMLRGSILGRSRKFSELQNECLFKSYKDKCVCVCVCLYTHYYYLQQFSMS